MAMGTIKKILLTVFLIPLTLFVFSQELNVGGFSATNWKVESSANILGVGASIEYRPKKAVISFNSDISIFWVNRAPITTFPLTFKIIIGNKLRVCPTFGGFIRTNENYGYSAGLCADYRVLKKVRLFIKAEYMRDYWKDEFYTWDKYNYVGEKKINSNSGYSIWVNLGVKINVLKS